VRSTVPPLPHPPDGNDSDAVLVHQEDVVRRELAELLAEPVPVATDRGEALIDQHAKPGSRLLAQRACVGVVEEVVHSVVSPRPNW
jgi:hypothetical protein